MTVERILVIGKTSPQWSKKRRDLLICTTDTTKVSQDDRMNRYRLSVVVEKDADGYFVFCPELQGCYSQGDTYEEALENIKDAIRLHIEDRLENGEVFLS